MRHFQAKQTNTMQSAIKIVKDNFKCLLCICVCMQRKFFVYTMKSNKYLVNGEDSFLVRVCVYVCSCLSLFHGYF